MGRKLSAVILVAMCLVALVAFVNFGEKTGAFNKLPEAAYLTEEEEKVRPAYQQLSDKEKAIYEALYRGINEKNERIPLPYEVPGDTYSRVYCMLEKQEGSFFYLGSSYYTADRLREAQIVYRDGLDKADSKKAEVQKAEKRALQAVEQRTSDYEKVMAINDYIVKNCRYVSGVNKEYSPTVYGCLVEKEANCEGYAKTFNMLAADVGLESMLITGVTDKGENHAWNQVKVDGDWYNIDVTWADTDEGDDIRRAYFLCDDNDFVITHEADKKFLTPMECTAVKCNYYIRNGLYINSDSEAEQLIISSIINGDDMIEMKFATYQLYEEFKRKYITDQYIFQLITENGGMFESDLTVSIKEGEGDRCITLFLN